MNKVILMGRLTKKPELKKTASDISVASFGIAVQRRFKNSSGGYDADFINCSAWRNTAEFIERFFDKGSMIAVVGSLQNRTWEDENGNRHVVSEVIVDEAYFCGGKSENSEQKGTENAGSTQAFEGVLKTNDFSASVDDDLPF